MILTIYLFFKSPNLAPINFISFRDPLNIYKEIKDRNISIQKAAEDQKRFKSNLNAIASRNPKHEEKYQWNVMKSIRNFIIYDKMLSI